eukprot:3664349-Prymnesium_polylepis.1
MRPRLKSRPGADVASTAPSPPFGPSQRSLRPIATVATHQPRWSRAPARSCSAAQGASSPTHTPRRSPAGSPPNRMSARRRANARAHFFWPSLLARVRDEEPLRADERIFCSSLNSSAPPPSASHSSKR